MNKNKSNMKLLATIAIMLLFASAMVATIPLANAAITITSAPFTGITPGDEITVIGTVTNPGATVSIYYDRIDREANRLTAGRADASGAFSIDVTIPPLAKGPHSIYAVEELGNVYGSGASTSIGLDIVPGITLTLGQEAIGYSVTIDGGGFTATTAASPNDAQFTFLDSALGVVISNLCGTVRVGANGGFTTSFIVPSRSDLNVPVLDGSYTVEAKDIIDTVDAPFTIGPVLTLTPDTGGEGTRVLASGRGFTPGGDIEFTGNLSGLVNYFNYLTLNTSSITVGSRGTFSTYLLIISGSRTPSSLHPITVTEHIIPASGRTALRNFNVTRTQATLNTSLPSGEPTTSQGPGTMISFTGSSFSAIAGTNVTVTLERPGTASYEVAKCTTSSAGTISGTFETPPLPTNRYSLVARDDNGIVGECDFAVALTPVIITPKAYDLATGDLIHISGIGFGVLGAFTANVSINGQILYNGLRINEVQVTNGIDAIIGVDGSTLEPGRYLVEIVTSTGLYGKTFIDVIKAADITVEPEVAPRNSTVTVTGVAFSPNEPVTIQIRNATSNVLVNTYNTRAGAIGNFTYELKLPVNFALGDYIINATDSNGITAAKPLTVAKVEINIALGASTYNQGDIGTFRLTSNTAPTGRIAIYDSNNSLVTTITLETAKWSRIDSGGYVYLQSSAGGVPSGALFTVASDARTGTWTWNATINDADEPQTYKDTFTVNARNTTPPPATPPPATPPPATPPPATPTPPPATPTPPPATPTPPTEPTPTPEEPGPDWTYIIIALVVVALIVGVIAVFLFVTMRRKIAN